MRLLRSEAVWVIWSALLVTMPFFAESLCFFPDACPMPGQPNMLALALPLLVALLLRRMCPYFGRGASLVGRVLSYVGAIATVALVAAETLLGLNRGYPYLNGTQAALYQALMPFEIACSAFAVLGWAVRSQCLEAPSEEVEPRAVVPPFALGFTWCLSCALLGWLQWPGGSTIVPYLVSGATALILLGAATRNGGLGQEAVLSFAMGWLAALCTKAIAWSGSAASTQAAYLVAGGLVVGVCCALSVMWARPLRTPRARKHEPMAGSQEEDREERIKAHLSGMAAKPLTGRESEVLVRTVLGEAAGGIAEALGIAEATVASYRRRGYQKLGVSGADELRGLVTELLCCECAEDDGVEPPAATSSRRSRAETVSLVPLAALIVGLWLLALLAGVGICASLPAAVVLLVAGLPKVVPATSAEDTCDTPAVRVPLGEMLLSVVCSSLLAVQLHSLWMGYRGLGVDLIALIALPPWSVVHSQRAGDRMSVSALRRRLGDYVGGFRRLYLSGSTPACFALMLVISDEVARTFFSGYCLFYYPALSGVTLLVNVVCLYLVVSDMRDRGRAVVQLSEGQEERALHYLRGRGLGELQAQVMLDLACGCDVGRIAESRFTTVATVRSYRRRSLDALGLNSIDELRKVMSSEAGFTTAGKLHHAK